MNESLDLFDDFIDVTTFKDSEQDKADKASTEKKEEVVKTTLNPMEGLEYDDKEEVEKEETQETEVENTDQEEVEHTEEEKELIQKVVDLKEMGALFLPDDYEIESLDKAVQDSEAFRNQVATKSVFDKIPDVEVPGVGNAKDLFLYLFEHGGEDIEKFKSNFGATSFDPKSFDLAKEEDRRKVLETFYQKKGFNDVKTKKMVDKIFDDMDDDTEAAEALGELTTLDAKAKQEHLKELETSKIQKQKDAQDAYNMMHGILEKNQVVGGYPIAKEEKSKALNSLYSQVNVGGQAMSDFDYRLNGVVLRNPELTLALSAILNTLTEDPKTKSVSFDLSKISRQEKTKAVKNLKEITSRVTAGKKNFSSSSDDTSGKKGFSWNNVIDYSEI
mgnify:CR=1 FL=1